MPMRKPKTKWIHDVIFKSKREIVARIKERHKNDPQEQEQGIY